MDTINKYLYIAAAVIFIGLLGYLSYVKNQRDSALDSLDQANNKIKLLQQSITITNKRLEAVSKVDSEYQEKLKNAQAQNDKLRDDLVNNNKRVYIRAECPSLPTNTTATSRIDAATPRLTDDARQNYLRLRLEISQTREQIKGLQGYINNVCLK